MPNERDDKGTTKVDVQLPPGFEHASYEPVAGLGRRDRARGLAEPIETDDGFEIDEQIGRVTWTGRAAQA